MKFLQTIKNGLLDENPVFRLVLGMCPTLAVTTSASNGVGMGIAATFVLICSNLFISMLRNVIPSKIRIPCYIVIIAAFVTVVQMVLEAYLPSLYDSLGVYIPLIVVNCIILGRAEAFASKNSVLLSVADGIGMGLGFTLAITIIGSVREFLGAGTIFGITILGASYQPMLVMILPPGAFLVLGSLLGLLNVIQNKGKAKKEGSRS
jgi:electron transport complex protein RnfE